MPTTSVVYDILARDNASKTFKKVAGSAETSGKRVSKLGSFFKSTAGKMVGIAAGAVAVDKVTRFIGSSITAASDLNETISKSRQIFGDASGAMEKWASGAAKSAGLSKQAALESAASFGDMFSQIGFGTGQAAKMSRGIVQLSADLGSFNNLPTAEVNDMIAASFRGEYDSLQRVIPNINAARVQTKALAMTGKTAASSLTAQEKATATLAIIQKDGSRAAGDFARTSGGLANQQKILKAQFENVKATIGQALLPVVTKLINFINTTGIPAMRLMATWVKDNLVPAFKRGGEIISVAMLKLAALFRQVWPDIKSIVQSAVSIIQSLWKRFGKIITDYARGSLKNVIKVIRGAFKVIKGIFKVVSSLLKGDWKGAWKGIKTILRGAVQIIKALVRQLWNTIKTEFRAAGRALKSIWDGIWDGIKDLARKGIRKVVDLIKGIPGEIRDLGSKFADAGGHLIGKFFDGLKSLGKIGKTVGTDLMNGVISAINWAIGKVNGFIPNKIAIPAAPDINLPDNPFPSIPHLAKGTNYFPGGAALVGERGPELVSMPRGARVHPADETRDMLGKGPLIGTVVQQAGESASVLADRLYWLTRTRG